MSDERYNNDASQQDAGPLTGDALGAFDTPLPDEDPAGAYGFATIPPDEPLETPRLSEDGWPILFDDSPATDAANDLNEGDAFSSWDSFQTSDAVEMPSQSEASFDQVAPLPVGDASAQKKSETEDPSNETTRSKRRKRGKKAKAARAEAQAATNDQAANESRGKRKKSNNQDRANEQVEHDLPEMPTPEEYAAQIAAAASSEAASIPTGKTTGSNYDFLWESDDTRTAAKGDAGTTTVVESDTDYLLLPHPDVFNAYPPEVQRKIMEWADRDVRARRDDESLRQDALIRAQAARERTMMAVPVAIILLCIICAAITGLFTRSAVFVVAFLIVAVAVILAIYFTRKNDLYAQSEPTDEDVEE